MYILSISMPKLHELKRYSKSVKVRSTVLHVHFQTHPQKKGQKCLDTVLHLRQPAIRHLHEQVS